MKYLAITLASVILNGCAAMADLGDQAANLGQVTVDKSAFDGTMSVKMSPTWMAPAEDTGISSASFQMGAMWRSDEPEHVLLELAHPSNTGRSNTYTRFTLLEVNIDGEMRSFEPGRTRFDSSNYNTVSKTIYTESSAYVTVPYDYLKRMMNAERCLLRISTSDGYVEADFTKPTRYGGVTTIGRLPPFIARVEGLLQQGRNAALVSPVSE